MNIELITGIAAAASTLAYLTMRLRYEMQMAQQNSYRVERYGRWLKGDVGSTVRVTDLLLAVVLLLYPANAWAWGGAFFINILKCTKELNRKSKKPLVCTQRVWRTFGVEALLVALLAAVVLPLVGVAYGVPLLEVCVVLTPLITIAAFVVLTPVEKAINRWYYNDAARILRSMPHLKIIAITGSYGKTSTKHYLYRILSEKYNVLMTPGSFNTTLGVIRTVREQLKPYHEVFIVEMGAKQAGDIREICELVHPSMGIITAVGEQHLESFGSIENVQRTKFELVDALPADGVGKYNLTNTLACCIIARELGLPDRQIRIAVADIRQVEHRLSIRAAGGLTIIDDAFNSNPHGSAMALEVLGSMKGGRRIVITPGMIELGAHQYDYNRVLGRNAARACDYVIVVGEFNRRAIVDGLHDEAFSAERIITVDTFAEATARLREIAQAGDAVLYENDLPDTFK